MKSFVFGLMCLAIAGLAFSDETSPVKTTFGELVSTFNSNEARFDEKFSERRIEVTGKIQRISRSFRSTPGSKIQDYMLMMTPEEVPQNLQVRFFISGVHRKRLSELEPAAEITVRGFCRGTTPLAGSPADFVPAIWIEDCEIQK